MIGVNSPRQRICNFKDEGYSRPCFFYFDPFPCAIRHSPVLCAQQYAIASTPSIRLTRSKSVKRLSSKLNLLLPSVFHSNIPHYSRGSVCHLMIQFVSLLYDKTNHVLLKEGRDLSSLLNFFKANNIGDFILFKPFEPVFSNKFPISQKLFYSLVSEQINKVGNEFDTFLSVGVSGNVDQCSLCLQRY